MTLLFIYLLVFLGECVSASALLANSDGKKTQQVASSLSPFLSPTVAYIGLGRGGGREGEIWVPAALPRMRYFAPHHLRWGKGRRGKKGV